MPSVYFTHRKHLFTPPFTRLESLEKAVVTSGKGEEF